MKPLELDPRSLKPNTWNSNRVSPENFEKLKNSIRELGFAGAVVVRTLESGEYQILGGQHRVLAAIDLGIKTIPVVSVGEIDDVKARKIGLVDNARSGNDEVIQLAKIFEEIGEGSELLTSILPVSQADIDAVLGVADINLDDFDIVIDEEDEEPDPGAAPRERPVRTHDVIKFRLSLPDAERIRQLIEKTIKREGLKDGDDLTNAGQALAILLAGETS